MAEPKRHRRRGDTIADRLPVLDRPTAGGPRDWPALVELLGHALDTAKATRRPLSVCLVATEHPMTAVAIARRTIRGTDGAWRVAPERVAVIFVDAGGPSSEPAFTRLSSALANGLGVPARIGWASAASGIDAASLLDLAESRLEAVAAGR